MRRAPSPHPSLPELIPQEEIPQTTSRATGRWMQYPGGQRTGATAEERRRVLRGQSGVTTAEITAKLWAIEEAEQAQHAQAQQLLWNRLERNDSVSVPVENTFRHVPVDDFGSNPPSGAREADPPFWAPEYRARRRERDGSARGAVENTFRHVPVADFGSNPSNTARAIPSPISHQDYRTRRRAAGPQPRNPWQPTEEDLRRLGRRPNEYPRFTPSISTDRATLREPLPSLPPAPLTPEHNGDQDAAHNDSDDEIPSSDQDFVDATRIANLYLDHLS